MFKAVITRSVDQDLVDDIVGIDRDSFPKGWAFSDAKEYFTEILKNDSSVRVILTNDGVTVGYLLAVPHNLARKDLEEDDSLINEDVQRFYIESVAVLPAFQKKGGFSKLFLTFLKLLKEWGIKRISLHARISNGLSNFIQKKMKVTEIRRINKWKYYNYEEPTDYIEADIL